MSKFFTFYRIGLRHPWLVLAFFALCSILSIIAVSRLEIVTNLESLLPKDTQSVRDSEELKKYFEGNNNFMVVVEHSDPDLAENFADNFVGRIRGWDGISYVDYKRPVEFFKDRQWLYLDVDDHHIDVLLLDHYRR